MAAVCGRGEELGKLEVVLGIIIVNSHRRPENEMVEPTGVPHLRATFLRWAICKFYIISFSDAT